MTDICGATYQFDSDGVTICLLPAGHDGRHGEKLRPSTSEPLASGQTSPEIPDEAIDAAEYVQLHHTTNLFLNPEDAEKVLRAAYPALVAQVREQIAAAIEAELYGRYIERGEEAVIEQAARIARGETA